MEVHQPNSLLVLMFSVVSDLVRAMDPLPDGMQMDFLRASSYVGASTSSEDAVSLGLVSKISVTGRHILLVEDIIDTGKTLKVQFLAMRILKTQIVRLSICCLTNFWDAG